MQGDRPLVHYVWPLNDEDEPPLDALDDLTAILGWLGWAIDSAFATARLSTIELLDSEQLPKNTLARYQPMVKTTRTDGSLRVPKPGTLVDLERLHSLNRNGSSDQTQRRKKTWPKTFDRFIYSTTDHLDSRPIRRHQSSGCAWLASETQFRDADRYRDLW